MEKVGIDTLKRDLTILAKIVMTVDKAKADGKIKVAEWIEMAIKGAKLIEVAKTIKAAKREYLELDGGERIELAEHIANELDMRNDETEKMIEGLAVLAIGLSDTLNVLEGFKQETK